MAYHQVEECMKLLLEKELSLAFVESATAGRLCAEFALTKDCGKSLRGGIICYDAELKKEILKIPEPLLNKYSPESEEVTECLAQNLGAVIQSDIAVAVTGLTASGGSESEAKPVGTMFVCIKSSNKIIHRRFLFSGDAEHIVINTVIAVAVALTEHLHLP